MPWIKVHHSIREHRKVITAAEKLEIGEPQMVGHLCLFWLWVMENSTSGMLEVSDSIVARVSGWKKSAKPFVEALVNARLVQRDYPAGLIMVNFDEHIGPVITAANKNRNRASEHRQRTRGSDGLTQPESGDWPGRETWT